MTILEVDIGNSRLKWRCVSSSTAAAADQYVTQAEPLAKDAKPDELLSIFIKVHQDVGTSQSISRVRVASVRSAAINASITQAVVNVFAIEPEFAATQAEMLGVLNSYVKPQSMGVDRWCAIVAAACGEGQGRACCVVDAGSALTIECIDANKRHLGGFILPGYRMQVQSLLGSTDNVAALQALDQAQHHLLPANNTSDAVANGVLLNLLGSVHAAYRMLAKRRAGEGCQPPLLIFTGGDAMKLASCRESILDDVDEHHCIVREQLVLDGLRFLLP